jgi:hypothetical protein
LVAVSVTHHGRQATQLLRIGAPVVASRKTPDTVIAAASCAFPTPRLADSCSAALGVTAASGVGLAATSGVVTTTEVAFVERFTYQPGA